MIGIVGGMGPEAGVDLSRKIMEQTLADRDQEHLPLLLWSDPERIADRTAFLQGRLKTNPGYRIAQILTRMEEAGVGIAGLACNSAHASQIFDVVLAELSEKKSGISLLHMVREVGNFIRQTYPERSTVGVLGTTGTYLAGQYDLIEEVGLQAVNLSEKAQQRLNLSIYHPVYGIKSTPDGYSEKASAILTESMEVLIRQGAGVIVLGCTEFPLIYTDRYFRGVPVVDSSLVLARALIRAHSPEKLKPWKS